MPFKQTDLLILGSGIAGLSLALKASDFCNVLVVTKNDAMESNTRYAQGGIASVMSSADHFESHVQDTLEAGSHLNDEQVVEDVVTAGPRLIQDLLKFGVKFSRSGQDEFDLGREGGHSQRRILHAKDITGYELQLKLLAKAKKTSRIRFLEFHHAIDLLTPRNLKKQKEGLHCFGAYVLNQKSGVIEPILAKAVVLATGGAGRTYLYSSNPDVATGDGIGMAYRSGAAISNLEFVQFHPTCLHHPRAKSFLISEALRGEGGKLRLMNGSRFMDDYHSMGELAPRDIVARAIDNELKKRGDRYVQLDMTHLSRDFLKSRFPTIYKECRKFGVDMAKEPIPVVPAAHYFCGGVKVNRKGRTSVNGLYAIGEVSCTGLHGANRLASNSLLEGVAFADFVAKDLAQRNDLEKISLDAIRPWDPGKASDPDEAVVIMQNWDEIRRMMWNYVGIVRSTKRLIRAQRRIDLLLKEVKEFYWDFKLGRDIIELRNICRVADLTIKCALARKESIGLHYTKDFTKTAKNSKKFNTVQKF